MQGGLIILDYGSQTSQLIARRVRELNVYCELLPWDAPAEQALAAKPLGIILSGGPNSVYESGAPVLPAYVLESALPVLGICYGMQLLAQALGGRVAAAEQREYGSARVSALPGNGLLPEGELHVWMSHGDRLEMLPPGFHALASSTNSPYAAMGNPQKRLYGLQFHPEVRHTPRGSEILHAFALKICAAHPAWTPQAIIDEAVQRVCTQTQGRGVLAAVSGGVDSSVMAALLHRAVGDALTAVFVDNGLLRAGEREQVENALLPRLGDALQVVDARGRFLDALKGIHEPEAKRAVVGETFIRVFEQAARQAGSPPFLAQGTIYPDVVESAAPERGKAQRIKAHHNVGGLPEKMDFALVEPLRYLFKDEVRAVGEALGLPESLVWRQPFPGPGLAVRCLGEVSAERLEVLRAADAIFTAELRAAGLLDKRRSLDEAGISQAFAALLPVRSVGVMGDARTYAETIALRAVTTDDFMTADWTRLPSDLLARVSSRIVNEVKGVNRVVYDITSKPPATIEWE